MGQTTAGFFSILSLIFLILILAGCSSPSGQQSNSPPGTPAVPLATSNPDLAGNAIGTVSGPENSVVVANNLFAHTMYTQLAGDPHAAGKNIFFSPFSLSSAFAVTYEGARGNTAREIKTVFHFPDNTTALRQDYSRITAGMTGNNTSSPISTANALWGEKTYQFSADYISTAERWYSVNVTNLDFIGQPEDSRQTINRWVATRTKDKISELLPAGSVGPLTRLVITNAVYFKGTWTKQFDSNDTGDADFTVSPGKIVTVKMMQRTGKDAVYPYAETADLQMISLPYTGDDKNDLSMVIILPKAGRITDAESALEPGHFSKLEQTASARRVKVYIPKFRILTDYSLAEPLAAMGMPTAFTNASDFSGMDGSRNLSISDVIHKAYVNVNEEGTEAAAATAVIMGVSMARPSGQEEPIPVFRADHPFTFLIKDNNSGAVLFMGRIMDPNG